MRQRKHEQTFQNAAKETKCGKESMNNPFQMWQRKHEKPFKMWKRKQNMAKEI